MNTKLLIQNLIKLQELDFDKREQTEAEGKEAEKKNAELRLQIPLPILNHYDRLLVRGKKGVAAVRHQTCTGCHMQVTRGVVINLMHAEDIQVCENCGRYLYLPPSNEAEAAPAPAGEKPAKAKKSAELACAA